MKKRPITVISTTFNRAPQLYRHLWTLNSQNYPHTDYRVIVIDDGSLDDTQAVIKHAIQAYPEMNIVNILTDRKEEGHFGGQGLAYNIGLRYAEEWGSEFVIQTGGDMLIPSFGIEKYMELQTNLRKRAWAIATFFGNLSEGIQKALGQPPDPTASYDELLSRLPDVLVGPNQYFIRPDRESLGNDYDVLAKVPDRYDWQPAERLLANPQALTLEEFPNQSHIYIGYPGDIPCDRSHPEWPTWQICRTEHWINIGGYDESGTGHFWEDEQIRFRFIQYSDDLIAKGKRGFCSIVHPSALVCCFHQPHIRQLSFDNRAAFLENIENYGFDVNRKRGIDWGRSRHTIVDIAERD